MVGDGDPRSLRSGVATKITDGGLLGAFHWYAEMRRAVLPWNALCCVVNKEQMGKENEAEGKRKGEGV
jgi:hypothetical protein